MLLSIFAIGLYFWIGAEIRYFSGRKPPTIFEWAGSWSYALYIVHPIALLLLYDTNSARTLPTYLAALSMALLGSVVFFYLVEKPSHILAQVTGRQITAAGGSPR